MSRHPPIPWPARCVGSQLRYESRLGYLYHFALRVQSAEAPTSWAETGMSQNVQQLQFPQTMSQESRSPLMKVSPPQPIRLSLPRAIDELGDPTLPHNNRLAWQEFDECKLKLRQRELTIESLRLHIQALTDRLTEANRCLVLLGERGPTGPSGLDKALWVAWLQYVAGLPDLPPTIHLAPYEDHGVAASIYDALMDKIERALGG